MRAALLCLLFAIFAVLKIMAEQKIGATSPHRADIALPIGERFSQNTLIATLSGFRAVMADILYIEAHVAWERVEWSRMLLLFREATALQPHTILFWDTAAWHMAWNASNAALNDPQQPRATLRVKRQREFIEVGKRFLEDGIRYNPEQPELHEALARLYRDKLHDHKAASDSFSRAAGLPGAASYDERFAAYELSYSAGSERDAYALLRGLYERGERERLPTLIARIRALEDKLGVPSDQRLFQ